MRTTGKLVLCSEDEIHLPLDTSKSQANKIFGGRRTKYPCLCFSVPALPDVFVVSRIDSIDHQHNQNPLVRIRAAIILPTTYQHPRLGNVIWIWTRIPKKQYEAELLTFRTAFQKHAAPNVRKVLFRLIPPEHDEERENLL